MDRSRIMRTVVTALFTALVAAGAFIRIPMVPVPMTLQTFFALVAAACLPPTMATVSMLVYLFLGTVGLPIFTSGGGLAALLGPTGGYLIGLVPAVLAGSLVMKTSSSIGTRGAAILSVVVTNVLVYLIGLPWLSASLGLSFTATIAAGLLPYIVGDVVKSVVTVTVAPSVRARVVDLVSRDDERETC